MSTIDIVLDRIDRELVRGHVIVNATNAFSHQGLSMRVQGTAKLQLSAKSVGLLDAFYNTVAPMDLVYFHITIAGPGRVPVGISKLPFEFELLGIDKNQGLVETYHGVYVSVKYEIVCDCVRGLMKKNLHANVEFIVQVPLLEALPDAPEDFVITPEKIENIRSSMKNVPAFYITGRVHRTNCPVNMPFTGEITIESASTPLKSIELQLIRVESVVHAESIARDATEIQNVQIGWGDVCRQVAIPIYMIFPRLFTCPSMLTPVQFEVNVVVLFEDGYMITENFPIHLYR
ncbi:hypothetical protein THRCLA_03696 [Thraustotheca clavata]|uniref:Down syndrome critical region protein 3 n=1 Tax=Thraustotheca clavata TaxID=74557 RepID=A0A1W0A187_9STRA|nr:hypothetical protein THRCLA_03696 [Thraustotheca clavata]